MRVLAAAALACALLAVVASRTASASVPPGPRLVFLESHLKEEEKPNAKRLEGRTSLLTVDPTGADRRLLFATPGLVPMAFGPVSWSADGGEVAFLAEPVDEVVADDGAQVSLRVYVADADGSHLHSVPGTTGSTSSPVLSPDGESVAYTVVHRNRPKLNPKHPKSFFTALQHQYVSATAWIAPVAGGRARRLTRWQNGRWGRPSSFSPDGSTLAVTMDPPRGREEVDTIDLATGKIRTVEREAGEAAFSPDGSRIAFTSYRDRQAVPGFDRPEGTTELYVANADGSGAHRITHTPSKDETAPSWDPTGERLGYLRNPGGFLEFLGSSGQVMESNPDGSCPIVAAEPTVVGDGLEWAIGAPVWIPGAERGAGPISC